MDTEIGKPVNWDLPLMMRDGRFVRLIPGKFKFISGQTHLLIVKTKLGYDKLVQCYEDGLYNSIPSDHDIINIPPTTQDAWVVKYADGSKRVLLTEPADAPLIDNPKLIKATLTYYDTP